MRNYGFLVTFLTFPGVIVHEIAHRFFCDLCRVPVLMVSYFKPDNEMAGFVRHGEVNSLFAAIIISLGPLLINSILCVVLTLPFVLPTFVLHAGHANPTLWILGWLGLSIGVHAFPSTQDLDNIIHHLETHSHSKTIHLLTKMILGPLRIFSLLGHVFWFGMAYAVCLSLIIPACL